MVHTYRVEEARFGAIAAAAGGFHVIREIRLSEDGMCEFRSLLGVRRVRAQQMFFVYRADDDDGFAVVRYRGGPLIKLSRPVEGFADLLTRLKALNPTIQVEGFATIHPSVASFPPCADPERAWEMGLLLRRLAKEEDEIATDRRTGRTRAGIALGDRRAGRTRAGVALDLAVIAAWLLVLAVWSWWWLLAAPFLFAYLHLRGWESSNEADGAD